MLHESSHMDESDCGRKYRTYFGSREKKWRWDEKEKHTCSQFCILRQLKLKIFVGLLRFQITKNGNTVYSLICCLMKFVVLTVCIFEESTCQVLVWKYKIPNLSGKIHGRYCTDFFSLPTSNVTPVNTKQWLQGNRCCNHEVDYR